MASVRLIGFDDPSIDFTFSDNPQTSINFEGVQKWARHPIPRQEGSIKHNMGAADLTFDWSGVLDGDNAFDDLQILDCMRRAGAVLKVIYLELTIEYVIL